MKSETLFTIEDTDPEKVQPEKALEAVSLLHDRFSELATDKALASVSRIQSNHFSVEDVFVYSQTINEVGMKTIESCAKRCSELTPDQREEPRNKHYTQGVQTTVGQAVQIANDFVKAFHLQKAQEDFKACQVQYALRHSEEKNEPDS